MAIADYFDVNVAWLMGFDVEKFLPPDDEPDEQEEVPKTIEARIISGGIDKMPPDLREQALKVMQTIFSIYFDGGKDNET